MAVLVTAPPALTGELALFHTTDPFLANAPVLIFHGPAATVGATSSRIQLHIFTIGGHASYNRLAVSPSSPFYTAVRNLPREEQGDEIIRSIAFGLRKYFAELPQGVKDELGQHIKTMSTASLFGDDHVAILASRLSSVQNVTKVGEDLVKSFAEQKMSWTDIDVIMPPGSIKAVQQDESSRTSEGEQLSFEQRYGKYADTVHAFGSVSFLPTSHLKRAPSTISSIGRTASFLRQQKQKVRHEVLEVVSTEQNYLGRLQELEQVRDSTKSETDTDLLDAVTDMLKVNQDLLKSIQNIIDSTATSSASEIDGMISEQPSAQQIRQDLLADNHGIVAFSKSLSEHLPHFRQPYTSYMKSHEEVMSTLKARMRAADAPSALTKLGEQRLTSLLIEPIQRLPRYTLYIDEISKQLPARHPALKHLLKAKDIVTSICDEGDGDALEEQNTTAKLQARIDGWPADLTGVGRLVTAVDYLALRPPYDIENCVTERGMLLLTTDGLAMVEKTESRALPARVFLTDVEAARKHSTPSKDYSFLRWLPLRTIECSESHEGQSICLTIFPEADDDLAESSMVLLLEGAYEGKAARVTEDIAKARVEARFSDEERESAKWEVRATEASIGTTKLISAVFEDTNPTHRSLRRDVAAIRVVVDVDKHSQRYRAGRDGVHTVLALSIARDGSCRLSTDTIDGAPVSEQIDPVELGLAIQRRVATALATRYSTYSQRMLRLYIHHSRDVLHSVQLQFEAKATATKVAQPEVASTHRQNPLRPLSPVKMLSNLLSSSIGPGQPATTLKKEMSGSSILKTGAGFGMLSTSRSNASHASASDSRPVSNDQPRPKSASSTRSYIASSEPVKRLEDTLSAYLLALQARKGNIVGRNLRMRAEADELAVNELYNHLLENSQLMVVAAQAPIDVLFAAFEKFLRIAWAEQVGPVLPITFLVRTQSKAETLFPSDFDEYFRSALCSLSSSSQTAFRGIINLLNDLLDGTGNDADRGALIATFAEVLVHEGDATQYIALIDKFVNDAETYFGEPLTESMLQAELDVKAGASHKRARSVNTGSLTSNTSSLRRKFGLGGLSRENSRSENDGKTNSVWRTLSKSRSKEASPGSTLSSRTNLQRARSTDSDSHHNERPVSSDSPLHRPAANDYLAVPTLPPSILPGLSTIGEHPSFIPTGPPRKKRRSSLSDLHMLATPFATPQRPAHTPQAALDKSLPTSPTASTPSYKNNSIRLHTPARVTPRPALPASFRQDLSPSHLAKSQISTPSGSTSLAPVSPGSKQRQGSNIPTFAARTGSPGKPMPSTPQRPGLSERTDGGNIVKQASPRTLKAGDVSATKVALASPTKKMRLQSPQKIRERLQAEHGAIAAAHSNLQDELRKLGDELASTPSRMGSIRVQTAVSGNTENDIQTRLNKLESTSSENFTTLSANYDKLQADALASLVAYESRSKKLDELYREANAENEALYARFNDELARVLKAVRGGEGVDQLRQRVKQQDDEVARLKRENARLKREIAGAVHK